MLIIYRRFDLLDQVVRELNSVELDTLYIVSDGPRTEKDSDAVQQSRLVASGAKAKNIIHITSESNLGVKENVVRGISAALSSSGQAIVLEDDCLPGREFFETCENVSKLLSRDKNLAGFCGSSFLPRANGKGLWRSRRLNVWGWMVNGSVWKAFLESGFLQLDSSTLAKTKIGFNRLPLLTRCELERIIRHLDRIDTWDIQFESFCISNEYHFLKAKGNLVTNIGFGGNATNTRHIGSSLSRERIGPAINSETIPESVSLLKENLEQLWRVQALSKEALGIIFRAVKRFFLKSS